MKTHMDLNGWRIERVARPYSPKPWFHLWMRGEKFPRAGGSLEHIATALSKIEAR